MPVITHVVKRTGAVVPFNRDRITNAPTPSTGPRWP